MRHFAKLVLSLAVLAFLAGPAAAQGQGNRGDRGDRGDRGENRERGERADRGGAGGMDRGPALGMLLTNKSVQEELKLSNEQARKVEAAVGEVRQRHRQDFERLRSGSASERAERLERIGELRREIDEETREALRGVLQPEQVRRLRQIRLQARGADALASPRVAEALDLTADQKAKIQDITEDAHHDAREIFQNAGDDRQEAMRKLHALHKETTERACAVLTDKQKDQYKELAGEPFEIKWEARRGGDEGRRDGDEGRRGGDEGRRGGDQR